MVMSVNIIVSYVCVVREWLHIYGCNTPRKIRGCVPTLLLMKSPMRRPPAMSLRPKVGEET